jgi:hypothetical protein
MTSGGFFAMEQLEGNDKDKHDLRYVSLMRYLSVRGDSYQEHQLDLVRKPYDEPPNVREAVRLGEQQ